MNDQIELRQFRRAKFVAELRNYRLAAERLHTVQPNLSNDVKQFQKALNVQLFTITARRKVELTRAGAAFPPIAQEVFDTIDDGIAALRSIHNDERTVLRFGWGPLVDFEVFQTACEIHRTLLPNGSIVPRQGDTSQLEREIADGQLDAAIIAMPVTDRRLAAEEIRRERLVVCFRADDPLARKTRISPADLEQRRAILYDPQQHPATHARLMEMLEDAGVRIDQFGHACDFSAFEMLVRNRYGFALMCEGAIRDPELTGRPILGCNWSVETAFVFNREHHPEIFRMFLRLLKRHFADHKAVVDWSGAPIRPLRTSKASGVKPGQLTLFTAVESAPCEPAQRYLA